MKWLTIDMTPEHAFSALAENEGLRGVSFFPMGIKARQDQVGVLDNLLHGAGWKWSDLDFIGLVGGRDQEMAAWLQARFLAAWPIPILYLQREQTAPETGTGKPAGHVGLDQGFNAVQAFFRQWQRWGPGEPALPLLLARAEGACSPIEPSIGETMSNRIKVRSMREEDVKDVMKIEMASFPSPWSPLAFVTELRYNGDAYYFCLLIENTLAGYLGLWLRGEEGHITTLAIAPERRNQRWGEYLIRYVIGEMQKEGMTMVNLEVRSSNMAGRRFYSRLGFVQTGLKKHYYEDSGEDGISMQLKWSGKDS